MNSLLTKERLLQIIEEERNKLAQEDECKANKLSLNIDLDTISPGLKVCDKKSGLVYTVDAVNLGDISEADGMIEKGVSLKTPTGQIFHVSEKEFKKNYKVE
jgi:hypothetical protein|tara:strand:- start:140 stop:445 length:306 start_codon:yes stop_codon:yes gene_type:complete